MVTKLSRYFLAAILAGSAAVAQAGTAQPVAGEQKDEATQAVPTATPADGYDERADADRDHHHAMPRATDADKASPGSGSGEPESRDPGVKMNQRDPNDPFLQQIWTAP
jgi:hypothetical protein